ncbi:MAG: hypothetical protein ACE5E8_11815 [Acidimicrobiia bacterium]
MKELHATALSGEIPDVPDDPRRLIELRFEARRQLDAWRIVVKTLEERLRSQQVAYREGPNIYYPSKSRRYTVADREGLLQWLGGVMPDSARNIVEVFGCRNIRITGLRAAAAHRDTTEESLRDTFGIECKESDIFARRSAGEAPRWLRDLSDGEFRRRGEASGGEVRGSPAGGA